MLPMGTKPEVRASRKFRLLFIREFNVERKASMLDSSRFSSSTPISRAILSPARKRSRYSGLDLASSLMYSVA